MDIKAAFRQVLPFDARAAADAKKATSTTGQTADRDANGQQAGQEQKPKRDLSPQEVDEAVNYIKALDGVKNHGLLVRVENTEGVVVVYIEDAQGKTVRRIPAAELYQLTKDRQKTSGHILNKAM